MPQCLFPGALPALVDISALVCHWYISFRLLCFVPPYSPVETVSSWSPLKPFHTLDHGFLPSSSLPCRYFLRYSLINCGFSLSLDVILAFAVISVFSGFYLFQVTEIPSLPFMCIAPRNFAPPSHTSAYSSVGTDTFLRISIWILVLRWESLSIMSILAIYVSPFSFTISVCASEEQLFVLSTSRNIHWSSIRDFSCPHFHLRYTGLPICLFQSSTMHLMYSLSLSVSQCLLVPSRFVSAVLSVLWNPREITRYCQHRHRILPYLDSSRCCFYCYDHVVNECLGWAWWSTLPATPRNFSTHWYSLI